LEEEEEDDDDDDDGMVLNGNNVSRKLSCRAKAKSSGMSKDGKQPEDMSEEVKSREVESKWL